MKIIKVANSEYPIAGTTVDGLNVLDDIPNTSSISATFSEYEVLPGIREVPMSDFGGPESVFYAKDDFDRSRLLAKEILQSKNIKPLIVVVESDGPYILEGAHRFVALLYLHKKVFPALVVLNNEEDDETI